jgi:AraC family ethanolamine operon transcriptional activator
VSTVSTSDFFDFESFREHLWGWDTHPVQLGSGALRIHRDELRLPQLSLSNLEFDRHIADSSAQDAGTLGFVVAHRPYLWCGLQVPAGSLVVLAPGRDYRCSMPDGSRTFEMAVSASLLEELGMITGLLDPRDFAPERCVISLSPSQLASFEQIAKVLRSHSGEQLRAEQVEDLQRRSLGTLTAALRGARAPGLRRASFQNLARKALRTIDNSKQKLSVQALARSLGVTPRALEYAFKSSTGVTTSQFLLSQRLNRVRADLLACERPSVTSAASQHGFQHMGRLSAQYRRLFGELPSQTRRAR